VKGQGVEEGQGQELSLGSLGQFAGGRGSPLRGGYLGGLAAVGRAAGGGSAVVGHVLRGVGANRLDVRDVEVGRVAPAAAASAAARLAGGSPLWGKKTRNRSS